MFSRLRDWLAFAWDRLTMDLPGWAADRWEDIKDELEARRQARKDREL